MQNEINKKYTLDKFREIIEMSLNNSINMKKRLSSNNKFADFTLVYYSFFLIFFSLIDIIFPLFFKDSWYTLLNISLSIILLIYSLENKNSRYVERIDKQEKTINLLKTLKRNESLPIEDLKKEYNKIIDNTEMREDVDFQYTLKSLCKEKGVYFWRKPNFDNYSEDKRKECERVKRYLAEHRKYTIQLKIFIDILIKFLILLLPLVYLVIQFIVNARGTL